MLTVLEQRRRGQGYKMWRMAMLIAWASVGKNYPDNPEEAVPELYPRPKTYPMPEFLRQKWLKRGH